MSGKQLVITIQGKDALTPTARRVVQSILGIGQTVLRTGAMVTRPIASVLRQLTSMRGIVLGLVGGAAIGGIVSSLNAAATTLDQIAKASQRLDIPVEQLSSLKYSADLANVSFETLLGGLDTAAKRLGEVAVTGGGRAAQAIDLLGVRITNTAGGLRDINELLPELADAINARPLQEREFFVTKIFGDPTWVNLLAEGGDRLRQFNDEAVRLGAVFTPEQTAIAEEYRDAISRVQSAWLGLKVKLLTEVGPAITDFLNRTASFIAAVPEIIGNVVRVVRTALGDGPEGVAARAALVAMFESWGDLAKAGVAGVGRVILATVQSAMKIILGDADTMLTTWFADLGKRAAHWGSVAYNEFMAGLPQPAWSKRVHTDRIAVEMAELDKLAAERRVRMATLTTAGFDLSLATDFPEMARALAKMREEMAAAGATAFAATDEVLGFMEALSGRAVGASRRGRGGSGGGDGRGPAWEWAEFGDGWRASWQEFERHALDAAAAGQQVANTIQAAIGIGLSDAIVDGISGVKSMEEAFRDFAATSLREISRVITQVLVLRAIAQIGGLFGGGVPSAAEGFGAGPQNLPIGGGFASPYAKGGFVRRFAPGGWVPGPNVNRDIVPALLTPGEFVMSRRGVAAVGLGNLQRMNRGGPIGPADGAGVNVNVTVHVAGGATNPTAIGTAAKKGVLAALAQMAHQFPGEREMFRRALA